MTPAQRSILEVCRAYEYIYDAFYAEGAPFQGNNPDPAKVAKILQDLCRAVNVAVLTTPAEAAEIKRLLAELAKAKADGRVMPDDVRSETNRLTADRDAALAKLKEQTTADAVRDALGRLVLAFDVGDLAHTTVNGRGYAALAEARAALAELPSAPPAAAKDDAVREALSQVLSFIRCAHLDMGGNHRYTLRSSPEFPAVMQRASDLLAAPHDPEAAARLAALPAAQVKEKT